MDAVVVLYFATELYIYIYSYLGKGGNVRHMLIPCVVIPHLQLTRNHVSDNIIYSYNEEQVLCKV